MFKGLKNNRFFLFLSFLVIISILPIVAYSNQNQKLIEPQQVIEKYFKYNNEKNLLGVYSTLNYFSFNRVFGFINIKSINLIRIAEDEINEKGSYLKYGKGFSSDIEENNIVVYSVLYEILYYKDNPPWISGKQSDYFILVRKDSNSPWLIEEIGKP